MIGGAPHKRIDQLQEAVAIQASLVQGSHVNPAGANRLLRIDENGNQVDGDQSGHKQAD